MVSQDSFWLVARELCIRANLGTWFPRGYPPPWVILIAVVGIVVHVAEARKAVADILRALIDLVWAVQELAQVLLS